MSETQWNLEGQEGKEGQVEIPDVLWPYMRGARTIAASGM